MAATARRSPGAPTTRDRVLAAAAAEFAARGFDGAKVDRIAARARVNKAMLYYHFRSKTALYQTILLDLLRPRRQRRRSRSRAGTAPEAQLRGFVEAVAGTAFTQPQFPPMWLREIADGGRHLAPPIVAADAPRRRRRSARSSPTGTRRDAFAGSIRSSLKSASSRLCCSSPRRRPCARASSGSCRREIANAPGQEVVAHVLAATLAAVAPLESRPSSGSSRREKS